jgi:DNA-binding SARP family transcriptional activator/tetratricopeptide (TPR) repeat protein
MRYRILGPLSVTEDGQDVSITAGRDRVVLAVLLLRAGHVVSVAALVDAVWGTDPPATARGQLQTCVSRLRRVLPPGAIDRDPAGYRIDVRAGELDAAEFGRLVAAAREHRDADLFRRALGLWRGAALDGLDSSAVRQAATVLDDQHVAAIEDWADLELAAGRERDLVVELSALVDRFPLKERLRGQLMLALYRSGRQGDALAEYRRTRTMLTAELGVEPGRELQELQTAMLTGQVPDPERPRPVSATGSPVRCLPRTVGDFTGREAVVERLLGTIAAADPAGPVIAAIDGMAGSGKTTLALHVATLVGDRFPDAHLFVDLHGHSDRTPLEPAAALLILLRQLGISGERVPSSRSERLDLWRTELAARRVLVVFDNAASSQQVVDLLPTSAGSLALVTGRRRLAGLDGVRAESLPVLTEDEAVALLNRIAGDRVAVEPDAVIEVVRRCGALPLALRLAGSRLAHRPQWQVADLVRRMGTSALPALAAENRTVAGAFALSFQQLSDRTQLTFRLLGLYPGRSFDALAVAAIGELTLADAEDLLDDLEDVHLVEEPERGVFRLHDLLHEYAGALAVELPEADRQAAVVRALDLETHAATLTEPPSRRRKVMRDLRFAEPDRPDLLAELTDPAARLERTRPALAAMVEAALASKLPQYAWMLPRAAWRHLWSRGYLEDISELFTAARRAAIHADDHVAQALAANFLASASYLAGRYDQARVLLLESIRLLEEANDLEGLSRSRNSLASICNLTGRFAEAAEIAERTLRMTRRIDDVGIEVCLDALSMACSELGRHDEAIHYQRRRLLVVLDERDEQGIAHTMLHLIAMRRRAGSVAPELAERTVRVVLRRMEHLLYLPGELEARHELGDLLRAGGRYDEAMTELRSSMAKCRATGDGRMVAALVTVMAQTLAEAGDPVEATAVYRQAVALAQANSQSLEQARAEVGLGDCLAATDPAAARDLWLAAHRTFTRLELPDRARTEQRLAGTNRPVALADR